MFLFMTCSSLDAIYNLTLVFIMSSISFLLFGLTISINHFGCKLSGLSSLIFFCSTSAPNLIKTLATWTLFSFDAINRGELARKLLILIYAPFKQSISAISSFLTYAALCSGESSALFFKFKSAFYAQKYFTASVLFI